jgi:hypothetical protein
MNAIDAILFNPYRADSAGMRMAGLELPMIRDESQRTE